MNQTLRQTLFILLLCICLTPFITPPLALFIGIILAQTIGHPFLKHNKQATNILLKSSVVGLGFGMNINQALKAGKDGILFTVFSIILTFGLGYLISRLLKIENKISYLISSGTAICGGSAIAAVSPVIKADDKQISVSLGVVFILNSLALFIFPFIGHLFNLTEYQFGMWSAIAIHDTSSVVGASSIYGHEALQIATTIKLQRALWIIPLSLITALFYKSDDKKITIPYFIFLFIVAMCISSYLPQLKDLYSIIVLISKKGLTLTLFLIGAGLSMKTIKEVGIKPLIQGVILWFIISVTSLIIVLNYQ